MTIFNVLEINGAHAHNLFNTLFTRFDPIRCLHRPSHEQSSTNCFLSVTGEISFRRVLMGIFASRKSGNWKRYGLVVIYESLMVSSSSVSNSFGCRLWWSNEVIARINDCDCEEFGLSAHQIADSRTSSLLTFCAFIQVLIKYVAQHSLLNKKLRRQ